MIADYDLHRLGWKAFQDLCVALAEERLQRPVQTFLPTNDAGRDGAFLGSWDGDGKKESTIQCKFTSDLKRNLTLSMLSDELPKAKRLAMMGLADEPNDYFDTLRESVNRFAEALGTRVDLDLIKKSTESHIQSAVWRMEDDYVPDSKSATPAQQSAAKADSLDELFRDVDE